MQKYKKWSNFALLKSIKMTNKKLLFLLLMPVFCSCGYENFDERCAREAREITRKSCPRPVEEGIVLDSLTYDMATHTMTYYHTVSEPLDRDSLYTQEVKDALFDLQKKDVTQSVGLKAYKDKNVNFRYRYLSSSTGKTLLEHTVTPAHYTPKR